MRARARTLWHTHWHTRAPALKSCMLTDLHHAQSTGLHHDTDLQHVHWLTWITYTVLLAVASITLTYLLEFAALRMFSRTCQWPGNTYWPRQLLPTGSFVELQANPGYKQSSYGPMAQAIIIKSPHKHAPQTKRYSLRHPPRSAGKRSCNCSTGRSFFSCCVLSRDRPTFLQLCRLV